MGIHIKTVLGRYGNQLCPYFFGRILSENLNFHLHNDAKTHPDFLLHDFAYEQKEGLKSYEQPVQRIGKASTSHHNDDYHPDVDIFEIINDKTPRKIILDGYFQKKRYFLPFRKEILEWFNPVQYDISSNDVAVHVRVGDLRCHNLLKNLLPLEYYEQAIELCNPERVTICTDTPDDTIVKSLLQKYEGKLFKDTERNTLSFLASHNNLVLSQGSFSFWAGFFCDGQNIINAIPGTGWNSAENPEIDLLIEGPNYKYVKLC